MKIAILGASGRTGRLLVEQALAAGHDVRALVRNPDTFKLTHGKLHTQRGDASDAAAVKGLVEGCDAVVSTLGPTKERTDICSAATANVIAAGARRYAVVSGAGVDVEGDRKDFVGKVVSFMVRTLTPAVFQDKVRELGLLQASGLEWVLVRPPRLVDGPGKGGPRMGLQNAPGSSLTRADLATFLLRAVGDAALVRKAPFVAN